MPLCCAASGRRPSVPRTGRSSACRSSSTVLNVSSRAAPAKARPSPSTSPRARPRAVFRSSLGDAGGRDHGLVHDGQRRGGDRRLGGEERRQVGLVGDDVLLQLHEGGLVGVAQGALLLLLVQGGDRRPGRPSAGPGSWSIWSWIDLISCSLLPLIVGRAIDELLRHGVGDRGRARRARVGHLDGDDRRIRADVDRDLLEQIGRRDGQAELVDDLLRQLLGLDDRGVGGRDLLGGLQLVDVGHVHREGRPGDQLGRGLVGGRQDEAGREGDPGRDQRGR